jgi:hypothetical protein
MVVKLRLLQGEPSEMADLQRVLDAARRYAELITRAPPWGFCWSPRRTSGAVSVVPPSRIGTET